MFIVKTQFLRLQIVFIFWGVWVNFRQFIKTLLTLQAVSIQQLLAFLVHFDPTFCAAHTLPGNAPQQTLTLVAVGGRGGRPHLKVVRRGAGYGVYESLQGLLVNMVFLLEGMGTEIMERE